MNIKSLRYEVSFILLLRYMTDIALVLVDFQEERTNPDSEYYIGDIKDVITKVNYLIDHCRSREYKIILTKHRENDSLEYF